MPNRFAYIGNPPPAAGYPSIPMQAETRAYLARFSGSPSATYRAALNQFIYFCKNAGLWTVWQDLWLLCADTQADSMRNVVTAARDATIVGAPTFTALQGFSNLTSSNYVSLPYLAAGFGQFNQCNFAAGKGCAGNAGFADQIVFGTGKNGGLRLKTSTLTNSTNAGLVRLGSGPLISAMLYGYTWDNNFGPCEATSGSWSSSGTWNGGMEPSPLALNNVGGSAVVTQISAYGFTTAALQGGQLRRFLQYLATFLDAIGALPTS